MLTTPPLADKLNTGLISQTFNIQQHSKSNQVGIEHAIYSWSELVLLELEAQSGNRLERITEEVHELHFLVFLEVAQDVLRPADHTCRGCRTSFGAHLVLQMSHKHGVAGA